MPDDELAFTPEPAGIAQLKLTIDQTTYLLPGDPPAMYMLLAARLMQRSGSGTDVIRALALLFGADRLGEVIEQHSLSWNQVGQLFNVLWEHYSTMRREVEPGDDSRVIQLRPEE